MNKKIYYIYHMARLALACYLFEQGAVFIAAGKNI